MNTPRKPARNPTGKKNNPALFQGEVVEVR
jgi:hypothetical protein